MYNFKLIEELIWAAGISASVYILGELVFFNAATITDWHTWGIALASGSIRAAAGAMLAMIRKT